VDASSRRPPAEVHSAEPGHQREEIFLGYYGTGEGAGVGAGKEDGHAAA
jgi:hypothetical protein